MKRILPVLICFAVSCSSMVKSNNNDSELSVRKRASFEINCSQDKLKIIPIEYYPSGLLKYIGVEGCGKRLVYVEKTPGDWVLNSSSK